MATTMLETLPRSAPSLRMAIPPLRNGDHLDAREFHRRYSAMPHVKKAELIKGVVYMSSPVNSDWHGTPHSYVSGWAMTYSVFTAGSLPTDNATLKINKKNTPQPDVGLYIRPELGGRVEKTKKGYLARSLEFVAEISASSVGYDSHEKLDTYRRAAIQEYLIWRVEDEAIDWFQLVAGQYEKLPADAAGVIRSAVFPGLWLDAPALIRWDMKRVLEVLQQGLSSPEHTEFARRLEAKRI